VALPAIETQGLTKHYGRGARRVAALAGLNLTVGEGTIFGLLGPNGAGKTTLVKVLLGIIRATAGRAQLLGKSVRRSSAREGVGFLPEGHRFPRYLTGRRALWLYGHLAGYRGSELKREIHDKLEIVGLADWGKRKVKTYSKGMLQRLGLAQAMIGRPRLIFLDEPTDGVDPVGRVEIRDVLTRLRERGITIFLNSHLLSEVEQVCDRVAILHHGQVLREGTIDDLTANAHGTRFTLRVTPLVEEQAATIAADPRLTLDGLRVIATVEREDEIDEIVDRLRERGIGIRSLTEERQSLEDVFLGLVRGSEVRP
jgi:ABC-2 type transport system ATP-binding protein